MIEKLLLVNPVVLSALPRDNLALFEPESNLLLSILNTVRAMTNISANIDTIVSTDSSWGGGEGIGGTEESCDDIC
jgi:hypothetical protein